MFVCAFIFIFIYIFFSIFSQFDNLEANTHNFVIIWMNISNKQQIIIYFAIF